MSSETPSPVRDEGWIGPGGRKFLAAGISLIVLATGAYYAANGTEEIKDFFDELAAPPDQGGDPTVTLEDTTIESGELPPPEPKPSVPEVPAAPPGSPDAIDQQLERAQRQLECIQRAADVEAMARCVQTP